METENQFVVENIQLSVCNQIYLLEGITNRSEILKLVTSNSARLSFQENDGASGWAWNDSVLMVVDGTFVK